MLLQGTRRTLFSNGALNCNGGSAGRAAELLRQGLSVFQISRSGLFLELCQSFVLALVDSQKRQELAE